MTILNRRKFMQLLAGTAVAATVPLPPLPDAPAYSPSRDMMEAGKLLAQGFVDGISNALIVTDITTEAAYSYLETSGNYLREVPDWRRQIFTVHGVRATTYENATEQIEEEYRFLVESSEAPAGGWDEILEFVEGKLTPEHLTSATARVRFEGLND